LRQHPAVSACALVVREDAPDDKRLVAYFVQGSGARGQGPVDSSSEALIPDPRSLIPELRAFLAERLPDYMLPNAWVLLDALPLTASGKLDRRALPAPDGARSDQQAGFVVPRTPTEATLAQIWAEVLGLEQVGVRDDFSGWAGIR
jgi:acyl-coenzyme A synthetase/AMP-(fatty) acid ligase